MTRQEIIKRTGSFLFLPLLCFNFVLHGYIDFFDVLFLKNAVFLFFEYCLAAVLLFLLFYYVFGSWKKAALMAFFLLGFHFFFGAMHDRMKSLTGQGLFTRYSFIIPFAILSFSALFYFLKRSRSSFTQLTLYLNLLLILLAVMDLGRLGVKKFRSTDSKKARTETVLPVCDTCKKPDIYMIIADGYAGNQVLKTELGFDNTAFENELRSRKFHTVQHSVSNYNSTPYSIASVLNMEYMAGIDNNHESREDIRLCFEKINNSRLLLYLEKMGYKTVNYSIFNVAGEETQAEGFTLYPTKEKLISNQTFLSRLRRDIGYSLYPKIGLQSQITKFWYSVLKDNTNFTGLLVEESKKQSKTPRFVYTHLEMPHYPYYFKRDGSAMPLNKVLDVRKCNENDYLEYLQYTNKKLLQLVDQLIANTKSEAIIMLLSDHGYREFTDPSDVVHSFSNLNAIFMPGQQYGDFYNGMSNVNQFRVLLNTQFSQALPLLKDSTIIIR